MIDTLLLFDTMFVEKRVIVHRIVIVAFRYFAEDTAEINNNTIPKGKNEIYFKATKPHVLRCI